MEGVKGEYFGPVHSPIQVQLALSEKEDYVKGERKLIDDENANDGHEHEQAFDKGERVRDEKGNTWWVFYTKRGRVYVVSDDNALTKRSFPKSKLTVA